jgi:glucose/mannose-6-phosphate isomerase
MNMEQYIREFPKQLETATTICDAWTGSFEGFNATQVVVLGLGGSAFGGEIVRNVVRDTLAVPFTIFRSYELPKSVQAGALVLACSYSGNTEETLMSAKEAHKRGSTVVCITSGGQLADWAKQNGLHYIIIPGGQPPRTACGFSLTVQLRVLHRAGLISDPKIDIANALAVLHGFTEADRDQARQLALVLKGTVPAIYSSDTADSVAIRFRQQINENAKQLCWHHVLPEMNHNELVGWEHPIGFLHNQAAVILLTTDFEHPRNQVRVAINREIITRNLPASSFHQIHARGEGLLAQLLFLLHLGDWLSLYLAEANGADPMPVAVIDYLKNELAARP